MQKKDDFTRLLNAIRMLNNLYPQFEELVFQDEKITPQPVRSKMALPPMLAKARKLENLDGWQTTQEIFLKQARMLASYEEDYPYFGDPVRYYPTYQSLTDEELRGYFSWRAKIRKGEIPYSPLTFIFLYGYELINGIGVDGPEDGYEKLQALWRQFRPVSWNVDVCLKRWFTDYIVYYNLSPQLLRDSTQVVNDQCISVLENIKDQTPAAVLDAIKQLGSKWLGRSKFYASFYEDMDQVIYTVLAKMSAHYAKSCKRTLVEQFFGSRSPRHLHIFSQAVFCNPLNRVDYEYTVDSQYKYKCEGGIWTVSQMQVTPYSIKRLDNLLKTIDQVMRAHYSFGHPIKGEINTRWILRVIQETTQEFIAKKKEKLKPKLTINFSTLSKIRSDAAITREKLIAPEEVEVEISATPPVDDNLTRNETDSATGPLQLNPLETRFLRSLLYGLDTDWLKKEGQIASVLADAINEKLYERFGDSVLDETFQPLNDYLEELKEMLPQ